MCLRTRLLLRYEEMQRRLPHGAGLFNNGPTGRFGGKNLRLRPCAEV